MLKSPYLSLMEFLCGSPGLILAGDIYWQVLFFDTDIYTSSINGKDKKKEVKLKTFFCLFINLFSYLRLNLWVRMVPFAIQAPKLHSKEIINKKLDRKAERKKDGNNYL